MSAEQWQLSLSVLYATADSLEAATEAAPSAAPDPIVVLSLPVEAPPSRSTMRTLASAAVHSALTVGVLLAGFALVDPLLPHPERPHLADPVVAVDETTAPVRAIPPSGAYRP